jgi:hypothetical protein
MIDESGKVTIPPDYDYGVNVTCVVQSMESMKQNKMPTSLP